MDWLQLTLTVAGEEAERVRILLEQAGAVAVTFQDAGDEPFYEPPPGTTPIWQATHVRGLFSQPAALEPVVATIRAALGAEQPVRHAIELVPDRAWERVWLERFEPVRFGKRLWVVPSSHAVPDEAQAYLMLDPGLAFGTGAHPTTALCLAWLDAQPLDGRLVIDYGCGSGILALAALKLGARHAYAIDNDLQALAATADNAERNGLGARVSTHTPDTMANVACDVLVANILANTLIALAGTLAQRVRKHGALALCGILQEQLDAVARAYTPHFNLHPPALEPPWALLSGVKI